ncbi:MAG: heme biosynthesis HemY N-terminal domain-containing protein [Alphaproteobacteria bacterium]
MIRLIWFIIKFAAIVMAAVWLAEHPGQVNIAWEDYQIKTTAAFLCVAVFLLVAACLLVYRLIRLVRYGPRGIRVRRKLHQQQMGLQRLSQGMAAIAGGDASEAAKMALTARKLLGHGPLTHWLQAQAAQISGDHGTAGRLLTLLTQDPHSAPLGYRGLIAAALRDNDHAKAAMLIEEFAAKKPKAPWLQVARYELATRQGSWAKAATALRQASNQRLLDPATARRQEASLLVAEARAAIAQSQLPRALQVAEQALKLEPDWLPARIALVETQQAAGYGKLVIKRVEKFWDTSPHSELGALYRQQFDVLPPLKRYKRIEQLAQRAPHHPASLILVAEAAMAAELWGEARRALQRAADIGPTRQIYRLLADLAGQEGLDQKSIVEHLQRAATAPPEAAWRCRHCGHQTQHWEITCTQCGAISGIDWFDPYATPKSASAPLEHSPL